MSRAKRLADDSHSPFHQEKHRVIKGRNPMASIAIPDTPTTIEYHIASIYQPLAMLAGMQLDLFTPLRDGPMSCAEIATALSVRADKLHPLLYALVNAGLLTLLWSCHG
jgi:hypothetical protein